MARTEADTSSARHPCRRSIASGARPRFSHRPYADRRLLGQPRLNTGIASAQGASAPLAESGTLKNAWTEGPLPTQCCGVCRLTSIRAAPSDRGGRRSPAGRARKIQIVAKHSHRLHLPAPTLGRRGDRAERQTSYARALVRRPSSAPARQNPGLSDDQAGPSG
jgi:hypothetical protein